MQNRRARAFRVDAAMRFILAGLVLAGVYFGGAGAAFFYRHRHLNEAAENLPPPLAAPQNSAARLLIFAPHCDDETLGCAGLIQQTLAAGGTVRTVIITNGDGFRTAVERQARKLQIGPSDYIQFASLRQKESLQALGAIGEPAKNISFLGYPDAGLMPIWNYHWKRSKPYISSYTRFDHSPYVRTYDPNSKYCGENVVRDIKSILRDFRPTLITVTHPAEDHPDHAAAAAFVAESFREVTLEPGQSYWARYAHLRYYLIHRGDWPLPQGLHPEAPLIPPAEMMHVDTIWSSVNLTKQQTRRKAFAISLYPSQMALMGHFLKSFARRSEIYGDIRPIALRLVPTGSITLSGQAQEWKALYPVIVDPVRDNVLRDLQGGGDIRTVYACHDRKDLYVRIDTRQPISSRMAYTVRIRTFGVGGQTTAADMAVRIRKGRGYASGSMNPDVDVKTRIDNRSLEIAIPWDILSVAPGQLSGHAIAMSVQTDLSGIEIDKTGVRLLSL